MQSLRNKEKNFYLKLQEGSIVEGRIKNITDYGVFVDLGGIDGLVHVTDISWKRINHPSELLELGQSLKVKVLKFDQELTRLSLGIKQLENDPWELVNDNLKIDDKITAPIFVINDQGIIITINEKFEGFIPLNELTWLKKPPHPSKLFEIKQDLEVKIIEIDNEKRRVSLQLKTIKK